MNPTKAIASNLGVTRLRPRQPTVSSKNNDAASTVGSCLPTVTGIPIRNTCTPRTSRPTNSRDSSSPPVSDQARRQSVAVSRIDGVQSTQQPRRTSQHVQITTTQLPSTNSNVRHNGQCIKCLRVLSLTAAGLLHSHGPGCPGSGQLPIPGYVQNMSSGLKQSTASFDTTIPSSYAVQSQSPEDIMEMLRQQRRRVLKRVPKASRIPAAEKLSETLRKVISNPDSVTSWSELMSFTFACFGVPGHRGGKRHLSSLASKVNQAIASFPTMSAPPVLNGIKPPKRRTQFNDIAARMSGKLEEGDIRGAIRLAASDDIMSPFDDVTAAVLREKHPIRAKTGSTPQPPCSETCLSVLESDILGAIKSFMPGSAGADQMVYVLST